MKPVILITSGIEQTGRGLVQQYCYKTYAEAISAAGGIPLLVADDANLEEMVDLADGLYLTGGNDVDPTMYHGFYGYCENLDPWRDALEYKMIHLFAKRKKPIFGICRGMQMINIAFGGTLYEDILARSNREHPFNIPHLVYTKEGSTLRHWYGAELTVNSFHHQAVHRLGEGLEITAWTADKIVEGIAHKTLPIIGVQWHPERMTGPNPFTPCGPDMKHLFEDFCKLCIEVRKEQSKKAAS